MCIRDSFSYGELTGRILRVTDFSGRSVTYGYDEYGDLVFARSPVVTGTSSGNDFPDGKITRYRYSSGFDAASNPALAFANHNLLEVEDAKGQTYLRNVYENDPDSYSFDRIISQQFVNESQVASYDYEPLNPDAEAGANQIKSCLLYTSDAADE